jgi:hypothetical protein
MSRRTQTDQHSAAFAMRRIFVERLGGFVDEDDPILGLSGAPTKHKKQKKPSKAARARRPR